MSSADQDAPNVERLRNEVMRAQVELKELLRTLDRMAIRHGESRSGFLQRAWVMVRGAGSLRLGQLASRAEKERQRSGLMETPALHEALEAYAREAREVIRRLEERKKEVQARIDVIREILRYVPEGPERARLIQLAVESAGLARAELARRRHLECARRLGSAIGAPPPAVPGKEFAAEMTAIRAEMVKRWRELKVWAVEDPDNDREWVRARRRIARKRIPRPDCPEWKPRGGR